MYLIICFSVSIFRREKKRLVLSQVKGLKSRYFFFDHLTVYALFLIFSIKPRLFIFFECLRLIFFFSNSVIKIWTWVLNNF